MTEQDKLSVNLLATHTLRVDAQQSDTGNLDDRLRLFWELESLGIRGPEETLYEEFSSSVKFQDGMFTITCTSRVLLYAMIDFKNSLGEPEIAS